MGAQQSLHLRFAAMVTVRFRPRQPAAAHHREARALANLDHHIAEHFAGFDRLMGGDNIGERHRHADNGVERSDRKGVCDGPGRGVSTSPSLSIPRAGPFCS
jgi:hypothetical protein